MSTRLVNQLLRVATITLVTAAGLALAWAIFMPLNEGDGAASEIANAASRPAGTSTRPTPGGTSLAAVRLRQNLGDPGPVPPPEAPSAAATPPRQMVVVGPADASGCPVSLAGTIGTSLALLRLQSNAIEVCAVGDSIAGVTVLAVRPAEADVRFNGQVVKLTKPPER